MSLKKLNNKIQQVLAKEVSTKEVLLLGIGSLVGGGVFTLLGPAIFLAGPAIMVALAINAIVSFLNIQTYASLSTTIPEAGGGNRWVKMGLGDFQGFFAGWISWLAHASACGLYALSGGFYLYVLLFSVLKIPQPFNLTLESFEKIFALIFILFFGWLNWRSNKKTQKIGSILVLLLLVILVAFAVSGSLRLTTLGAVSNWSINFNNFWQAGLLGIFSSAALFYIAFEGSEIQVQSGEEMDDPKKLTKALFGAWGVVAILYLIIAFVMIANGLPANLGEGTIIESARKFMPFGAIIMTIGGFLANIAALNATIFSSSRLAFSLARDESIYTKLSHIHPKNLTPDVATLISMLLIAIMVLSLPLIEVGAAASLLFVLLFLQLNIASIAIRKKNPDIKWNYHVKGYPLTPTIAIIIYIILAIATLFIVSAAWTVTAIWLLLGFINYYAYTRSRRRQAFEKGVLYEKTLRLGEKKACRVLLTIDHDAHSEEINKLSQFAFVTASFLEAEIIAVTINPGGAENISHQRQMMDRISELANEFNDQHDDFKIDTHTYVLSSDDVVKTILEIVREEACDVLILNWDGYVRSKGKIFGSKIDPVLRQVGSDLLVFKGDEFVPPKSILLAADYRLVSPFLRFTGKVTSAIATFFKSEVTILTVLPPNFKNSPAYEQWKTTFDFKVKNKIKLRPNIRYTVKVVESPSIAMSLLAESKNHDLVVLGGSQEKLFSEIRLGNLPEFLAKHLKKPFVIAKGHRGLTQPFIEYIKNRLGI